MDDGEELTPQAENESANPEATPLPAANQMKVRTKRIDLGFLGDGWDGCFLELRAPRLSDLTAPTINGQPRNDETLLKAAFIQGIMLNAADQQVPMTAEHIGQFDLDALTHIAKVYFGLPDPNA